MSAVVAVSAEMTSSALRSSCFVASSSITPSNLSPSVDTVGSDILSLSSRITMPGTFFRAHRRSMRSLAFRYFSVLGPLARSCMVSVTSDSGAPSGRRFLTSSSEYAAGGLTASLLSRLRVRFRICPATITGSGFALLYSGESAMKLRTPSVRYEDDWAMPCTAMR